MEHTHPETSARALRAAMQVALRLLRRYGPLDLAAAAATWPAYLFLCSNASSPATLGLACACAENVVFYAIALLRERARQEGSGRTGRACAKLCVEFGAAEALDLVLRPTLMVAGAGLGVPWGLFAGSLAADVVFYAAAAVACAAMQARVHRAPSGYSAVPTPAPASPRRSKARARA